MSCYYDWLEKWYFADTVVINCPFWAWLCIFFLFCWSSGYNFEYVPVFYCILIWLTVLFKLLFLWPYMVKVWYLKRNFPLHFFRFSCNVFSDESCSYHVLFHFGNHSLLMQITAVYSVIVLILFLLLILNVSSTSSTLRKIISSSDFSVKSFWSFSSLKVEHSKIRVNMTKVLNHF